MSRAPPNHNQQLSSAYSRNNLIDFVHVPQVPLGQAYEEGFHPSIYAQAGFPGYAVPQGYPAQLGVAYQPLPVQAYPVGYPQPIAAPACLPAASYAPELGSAVPPVESEAVLHQRINEKIDSIIQAQRDGMLNSKIESLSSKVQQLSHTLESKALEPRLELRAESRLEPRLEPRLESRIEPNASHIHRLADRVQELSEKLDAKHGVHISSEASSDAEISRRLRRLAAESSLRQRGESLSTKIPDW
jgi:outer membrane murein-binding lipoprotein Lpp